MKKYQLALRNDKAKGFELITWIILTLNYIALIFISVAGLFPIKALLAYLFVSGLAIFIQFYFRNAGEKLSMSVLFLILMTAWFNTDFWWAAVLNFIFEIFYLITRRPLNVIVNSENVLYPSFPQRKIQWQELSNMILKDGLLTIDFKNNTIIQQYIAETSPIINEKEFNEFCKQQLNK